MLKPIINPISEGLINHFIKNMPQSTLITGEHGVGIGYIAKYIAELKNIKPQIVLPEKDEKVDLIDGIISVDIMRRLYNQTKSKHSSDQIIIIDFAERMNQQAQNAFLKLLEEPNPGVYFIIVSHSVSRLLPTILSRTSKLEIRPITTDQSNELLDTLNITDSVKRQQMLFMANGLPAELSRLAKDPEYFNKQSSIIIDARDLLKSDTYQKMKVINKYKDSRLDALKLLINTANLLKLTAATNPQPDIFKKIESILHIYDLIEQNGNIKLVLAKLVA